MKRIKGSYTVEATMVMAVVLWTVAAIIQYSYQLYHEITAAMALQEKLEYSRQMWEGSNIKGSCQVGSWKLEIQMNVFHPEDFLRKCTLPDQLEDRGKDIQE